MSSGKTAKRTLATSAERFVTLRIVWILSMLFVAGRAGASEGAAPPSRSDLSVLPPPDADAFRVKAPLPQWDVGVLGGGAATARGDRDFGLEFWGALELDMTLLRERWDELGLGGRLRVGTSGFKDARFSLAPVAIVPIRDPVALDLSFGPLLATSGSGMLAGFEGSLGIGLRSVNLKGHYAHAHSLVLGYSQTFALDSVSQSEESMALWGALRVDAMWFVLPFGLLF